jgi:hypothetical protein
MRRSGALRCSGAGSGGCAMQRGERGRAEQGPRKCCCPAQRSAAHLSRSLKAPMRVPARLSWLALRPRWLLACGGKQPPGGSASRTRKPGRVERHAFGMHVHQRQACMKAGPPTISPKSQASPYTYTAEPSTPSRSSVSASSASLAAAAAARGSEAAASEGAGRGRRCGSGRGSARTPCWPQAAPQPLLPAQRSTAPPAPAALPSPDP